MVHRVRLHHYIIFQLTITLRLTAASTDFCLHLLTKSSSFRENVFPFGGGLSGHHGKINDMTFCGGRSEDSGRYVATVSGIPFYTFFPVALLRIFISR